MMLRADRVNARLALAFDLARGRCLARSAGAGEQLSVDGVGLFDVTTHPDMVQAANGFGLTGRVAARTRRIDNASVRDLLGGPGLVTARIAMDPSGLVHIADIRVAAPSLRVSSGGGTYAPNGALDIRAAGVASAYGPVAVHVTGTLNAPHVVLDAANPGFGIGLRNVHALVHATPQGWAVQGTGESAYGPFTADLVIVSGRGPMTILVNRLVFAGIEFHGRIVPPMGLRITLTLAGQGLTGTVH